MKTEELLAELEKNGYKNLRVLDDGCIVGVGELLFTTALYVDLSLFSWGKRYCYKTEQEAINACNAMVSEDSEPMVGYVAKRSK